MKDILKKKEDIIEDINKKIQSIDIFFEKLKVLEIENKNLKAEIEQIKINNIDENSDLDIYFNELKKKLNTKLSIKDIEDAFTHISYINQSVNKELGSINKIKTSIGSNIIILVARLYYLFESNKNINDINSCISTEKITETFYDYYKMHKHIKLSKGEKEIGTIKYLEQVNVLIYNIYVNEGYKKVYEILKEFISSSETNDYKSLLQIYTQKFQQSPIYEVIKSEKNNENLFTVRVSALNKFSIAKDKKKKNAEKKAAEKYIREHNIKINENKMMNLGKLRNKQSWDISRERKKGIANLLQEMDIPMGMIKEHIIDTALIHKSYNNSLETNKELLFIGASILDIELKRVLFNSIILDNLNAKEFIIKVSAILSDDNISKKVLDKHKNILLENMIFNKGVKIERVILDSYKALLGALIYCDFTNRLSGSLEVQDLIYKLINNMNFVQYENESYSIWLNGFKENMNIEIKEIYYDESQKENEHIFSCGMEVDLSYYNLNKIIIEAKDKNKLKMREAFARELYKELSKVYDITNNFNSIPNTESYNRFLANLIDYSLERKSLYYTRLKMIGGLLHDTWDDKKACIIINQLTERELYCQLNKLIKIWIKQHGITTVTKAISGNKNSIAEFLINDYNNSINIK